MRLGRRVRRISKQTGFGNRSLHELRHCFMADMFAMEAPVVIPESSKGHVTIRCREVGHRQLMPRLWATSTESKRTIRSRESAVMNRGMSI